jgi:hypothetical protein
MGGRMGGRRMGERMGGRRMGGRRMGERRMRERRMGERRMGGRTPQEIFISLNLWDLEGGGEAATLQIKERLIVVAL